MALYSSIEKQENGYFVNVPNRTIELKDDLPYLEYFANGNSVEAFMADEQVWGEDLTKYEGFAQTVSENVEKIKNSEILTMKN
jgi:mannitol-1-phosphate/altronate dehydrogenase